MRRRIRRIAAKVAAAWPYDMDMSGAPSGQRDWLDQLEANRVKAVTDIDQLDALFALEDPRGQD